MKNILHYFYNAMSIQCPVQKDKSNWYHLLQPLNCKHSHVIHLYWQIHKPEAISLTQKHIQCKCLTAAYISRNYEKATFDNQEKQTKINLQGRFLILEYLQCHGNENSINSGNC